MILKNVLHSNWTGRATSSLRVSKAGKFRFNDLDCRVELLQEAGVSLNFFHLWVDGEKVDRLDPDVGFTYLFYTDHQGLEAAVRTAVAYIANRW